MAGLLTKFAPFASPGPLHQPVNADDVADRLIHVSKLKAFKRDHSTAFSNADLVAAEVEAQQVVAKFCGGDVAPPWFGPALQAALQAALQPLRDDIARLSTNVSRLSIKVNNGTMQLDEDAIEAPPYGNNPAPNHFPTRILTLRNLVVGQTLTDIENFYELVHTGTLLVRKRRVNLAYGVRIV
jgi:hypothetical protein